MAGGQQGQILAKSSNADFDAEWVDAPVGGVLTVNSVSTEIVRNAAITAVKIAPNAIVVRGSVPPRFSDEIAQAAQTGGVFEAQIVPGSIGFADFGAEVNQAFSRIEGDIDRLDEAIAMSGAMSTMEIPQGHKFGVSVGVGNYQSREAMAFGVGFRPMDNVLIKVSGAYGFDSDKLLTAGSLSIGF